MSYVPFIKKICVVLSLCLFSLCKSNNANYLINGAFYQKHVFTASSCSWSWPKYGSTSLCDQNCGLQSEHRQTDTQTDTGTDKSLKTEGPMILSDDIFFFKTVIIGGPIMEEIKWAIEKLSALNTSKF